jgi:hypothetical protein
MEEERRRFFTRRNFKALAICLFATAIIYGTLTVVRHTLEKNAENMTYSTVYGTVQDVEEQNSYEYRFTLDVNGQTVYISSNSKDHEVGDTVQLYTQGTYFDETVVGLYNKQSPFTMAMFVILGLIAGTCSYALIWHFDWRLLPIYGVLAVLIVGIIGGF